MDASGGTAPDLAAFRQHAERAAALVRARPRGTRWLLSCDTDADGLCAAAVAFAALTKAGHRATVRASRDKTEAFYRRLAAEETDGHVLLDKGTSHADWLAEHARDSGRTVLLVDHHNLVGPVPEAPGFAMLNPRAAGLDGSHDASASTTALALALALLGEGALKLGPVALSGAIGDWQHMPRWQGWNLEVLQRCRAAGHVRDVPLPNLIGADLAHAASQARPPIPGLEGDLAAARAWVEGLGLPVEAEAEDLDRAQRTRLVSAIATRHLAAGRPDNVPHAIAATEWNAAKDQGLRQVFRIVDACGREGEHATGIAYLLGDGGATAQATAIFTRYRQAVAAGLTALQEQGTRRETAIQWAWTERADYTGMVAGLGMVHGVQDRLRPLCVLARRADGQVQVSTRGLPQMVGSGLDLGRATAHAARHVGAEGGGHPVAAGAVVPAGQVEAFLRALDEAVAAQLRAHPAPGGGAAGMPPAAAPAGEGMA
ncbi:MAG TPA: DHHA1 domain-containing protein [Candidatus Thermoplasmatota archaeon]|nr:DHHA1 domain-containing protein [Candidatus Thermoplasmatota archaeon]